MHSASTRGLALFLCIGLFQAVRTEAFCAQRPEIQPELSASPEDQEESDFLATRMSPLAACAVSTKNTGHRAAPGSACATETACTSESCGGFWCSASTLALLQGGFDDLSVGKDGFCTFTDTRSEEELVASATLSAKSPGSEDLMSVRVTPMSLCSLAQENTPHRISRSGCDAEDTCTGCGGVWCT
eukprot:TRINITY_DN105999_c0_g1_i1.p2 TRINITY_DN105999_c0_g1~~TRINITY_DN105999_c0_g1_i1.p2  ORF type:complete len:186 (-),score=28.74 TRINITY_DN105999_c0_g1_i1:445-1002(-)